MPIDELTVTYEIPIRLGFFVAVFGGMALWEVAAPRRALTEAKALRWVNNLGLVAFNMLLLRLIFPAAAVGVAFFAREHGWGVLNTLVIPRLAEVILSVAVLDMAIYLQHVMFHAAPTLWRLHRVHHADVDFDVTTGARFHPIEIILSMLIKFSVIAVLGPSPTAVVVFEVVLNATAMFNHGNVGLPRPVDRVLRWLVVTPDMHRVHHSTESDEANSNFGFNLPWWDRLFGTYRDQPRAGHKQMVIGLQSFRDTKRCARLPGMLAMPFQGRPTAYVLNRRG
jgi:sterol desaturase/sphingolipid hydroxylase (fatty acid hydroxylase superfamily)